MAKTVSLINMKGGVGKSTLTVNLAWHFAYTQWNKRVLVVDLDPQFNASQYLIGVSSYENLLENGKPTIWEIFEQNIRTPTGISVLSDPHAPIHNVWRRYDGTARLDLIPSRLELAFSLKNPGQKERQLAKFLRKVESEYDLILIDCAPTESVLTTAAYLASDYLLVPVKPEYLSSIGLPLLVNSMRDFKSDYDDHDLQLAGIVFNATTGYSPEEYLSKEKVREIAEANGWYVFKAEVPYSRSFPKGAREGRPIFWTSYSRWTQIERFNLFAQEFAQRIHL